ncbi:MAG TPA: S46 family peptidase, partial [Bacteroidales bacterium]|nr:S46 family peptidase [Bacteroidales bacterium]
ALDTLIATHYLPKEYAAMTVSQRHAYIQTIVTESVLFNIDSKDAFLKKVYTPKHNFKLSKLHTLLDSDPGILFVKQTMKHISNTLYKDYIDAAAELDSIQSLYYSCLFLYKGSELYADANSSMRVSFGNVLPYKTADAINYAAQSTAAGIPQKWQSGIVDYSYNARLDSLLQHKHYGSYSTDTLFVNFAASNHTSGGNSGSPVLNAYGNCIGVNFDRNKEGTMSDIYFDERFCRNISVDIRYILFCIEMYGQATNILQELEFVSPIK